MLLAAHVVHGLVAGMLFIVVLPPLVINFGSAKLGASASVLVPALFGAATLGPLVGGLVASPGLWRSIFAAEVVVAIVALVLARSVLAKREPQGADAPVDWFALLASGIGSLLIYLGVGALAGHDWTYPLALGPTAAGILVYVALILGEARKREPLVPVRELATSLALVGTIATVIGSATFSALTQSFSLTLLRIDGLDPRGTGLRVLAGVSHRDRERLRVRPPRHDEVGRGHRRGRAWRSSRSPRRARAPSRRSTRPRSDGCA